MTPAHVLLAIVAVTVIAYAVDRSARRRASRDVRRLAAGWRMNFGRVDSLRLTPRVARAFPVPGAANLLVWDVVYGIEGDRYRYYFTAGYTVGTVRAKRRVVRVGTFSEPRDRDKGAPASAVVLAPPTLKLIEQYQHLSLRQSAAASS